MEDGGKFHGPLVLFSCHLVYIVAIWYKLWFLVYNFKFWYVVPRKIWQPCPDFKKWNPTLKNRLCRSGQNL
jgi:hypothetical protein